MPEPRYRVVMWADDDCRRALAELGRILEDEGFDVRGFVDFDQALEELRRAEGARDGWALLVDIILPRDARGHALNPYVGIDLAHEAALLGCKTIAFLTVIGEAEVSAGIQRLSREHKGTRFRFFNKLRLLDEGKLDDLIGYLGGIDNALATSNR